MAKQPENLVLRILKEIQQTLAEHGRRFDQLDRRLEDIHRGMVTALGLGTNAHVRHDTVQKELDGIKKRLKRLEEKV
jgi:hypothetical protein